MVGTFSRIRGTCPWDAFGLSRILGNYFATMSRNVRECPAQNRRLPGSCSQGPRVRLGMFLFWAAHLPAAEKAAAYGLTANGIEGW